MNALICVGNQPYDCGHPNTPENTTRMNGFVTGCRECRCERSRNAHRLDTAARNIRNAEIARRSADGETRDDLARSFRISPSQVSKIVCDLRETGRADPFFASRALKVAAGLAGATVPQLISGWRSPPVLIHARWAVMAALRKRGVSYPRIGRHMGGRDHSTVIYGVNQAAIHAAKSAEFRALCDAVNAA